MKVWQTIGWMFFVAGTLAVLGVDWDVIDQAAVTEWQDRMTRNMYFGMGLICMGFADLLEKEEDKE